MEPGRVFFPESEKGSEKKERPVYSSERSIFEVIGKLSHATSLLDEVFGAWNRVEFWTAT